MNNLEDILNRKREEFAGRQDAAGRLQAYFTDRYGKGMVQAQYKDGTLMLYARSGAASSRLRLDRSSLLEDLQQKFADMPVAKLRIVAMPQNRR